MVDAMNVGQEFFGLPAKDKERLCHDSTKFGQKGCKNSSQVGASLVDENSNTGGILCNTTFIHWNWRDTLQHHFHPLESYASSWPEKSTRYRHCDPTLITLIQQDVYGLQLLKDGQWLGVEPLSNAFVVNMSLLLEVISNGKLKLGMHRVVTNSVCSRTSLAISVSYPYDGSIQLAKSLISPTNPPLYGAFQYKDFLEFLFANNAECETAMKYLKL
ncbi:hypothetical protein ACH5RR_009432 [Cinchona calisaya]|uniref:Fe2OG dioxygenase domain-containing protein n=1 Tax=Cinchona calisaya TaxID=153742 RepID=A0ABD3AHE0_9GENT